MIEWIRVRVRVRQHSVEWIRVRFRVSVRQHSIEWIRVRVRVRQPSIKCLGSPPSTSLGHRRAKSLV